MERVPDIIATGQRWMNKILCGHNMKKNIRLYTVHQTAAAAAKSDTGIN